MWCLVYGVALLLRLVLEILIFVPRYFLVERTDQASWLWGLRAQAEVLYNANGEHTATLVQRMDCLRDPRACRPTPSDSSRLSARPTNRPSLGSEDDDPSASTISQSLGGSSFATESCGHPPTHPLQGIFGAGIAFQAGRHHHPMGYTTLDRLRTCTADEVAALEMPSCRIVVPPPLFDCRDNDSESWGTVHSSGDSACSGRDDLLLRGAAPSKQSAAVPLWGVWMLPHRQVAAADRTPGATDRDLGRPPSQVLLIPHRCATFASSRRLSIFGLTRRTTESMAGRFARAVKRGFVPPWYAVHARLQLLLATLDPLSQIVVEMSLVRSQLLRQEQPAPGVGHEATDSRKLSPCQSATDDMDDLDVQHHRPWYSAIPLTILHQAKVLMHHAALKLLGVPPEHVPLVLYPGRVSGGEVLQTAPARIYSTLQWEQCGVSAVTQTIKPRWAKADANAMTTSRARNGSSCPPQLSRDLTTLSDRAYPADLEMKSPRSFSMGGACSAPCTPLSQHGRPPHHYPPHAHAEPSPTPVGATPSLTRRSGIHWIGGRVPQHNVRGPIVVLLLCTSMVQGGLRGHMMRRLGAVCEALSALGSLRLEAALRSREVERTLTVSIATGDDEAVAAASLLPSDLQDVRYAQWYCGVASVHIRQGPVQWGGDAKVLRRDTHPGASGVDSESASLPSHHPSEQEGAVPINMYDVDRIIRALRRRLQYVHAERTGPPPSAESMSQTPFTPHLEEPGNDLNPLDTGAVSSLTCSSRAPASAEPPAGVKGSLARGSEVGSSRSSSPTGQAYPSSAISSDTHGDGPAPYAGGGHRKRHYARRVVVVGAGWSEMAGPLLEYLLAYRENSLLDGLFCVSHTLSSKFQLSQEDTSCLLSPATAAMAAGGARPPSYAPLLFHSQLLSRQTRGSARLLLLLARLLLIAKKLHTMRKLATRREMIMNRCHYHHQDNPPVTTPAAARDAPPTHCFFTDSLLALRMVREAVNREVESLGIGMQWVVAHAATHQDAESTFDDDPKRSTVDYSCASPTTDAMVNSLRQRRGLLAPITTLLDWESLLSLPEGGSAATPMGGGAVVSPVVAPLPAFCATADDLAEMANLNGSTTRNPNRSTANTTDYIAMSPHLFSPFSGRGGLVPPSNPTTLGHSSSHHPLTSPMQVANRPPRAPSPAVLQPPRTAVEPDGNTVRGVGYLYKMAMAQSLGLSSPMSDERGPHHPSMGEHPPRASTTGSTSDTLAVSAAPAVASAAAGKPSGPSHSPPPSLQVTSPSGSRQWVYTKDQCRASETDPQLLVCKRQPPQPRPVMLPHAASAAADAARQATSALIELRVRSAQHVGAQLSVPTLFLHAKDDDVAPISTLPLRQLVLNPHVITVLSRRGGHGIFMEHLRDIWSNPRLVVVEEESAGGGGAAAPGHGRCSHPSEGDAPNLLSTVAPDDATRQAGKGGEPASYRMRIEGATWTEQLLVEFVASAVLARPQPSASCR